MKKCPRCKEEKPKTEFHKSNTRLDRLAVYCKVCEKVRKVKEKDAYKDLYGLI
jgi:hypothetical protein